MAIITYSKKGISAVELQRQLGHKRYDTVWPLMHGIREAMGKRDGFYGLEGDIEFDEGHFEIATKESEKKAQKGARPNSPPQIIISSNMPRCFRFLIRRHSVGRALS
jgi:hypothetical protein